MSPEQGRDFESDDQSQKVQALLGTITDAIGEEDYEFAAEATLGQNLVSAADVIDYLHVQGKKEEDPVAQRRIRDGVVSVVASLHERDQAEANSGAERSLSQNEISRINAITEEIHLEQEVAGDETLGDEPSTKLGGDIRPNYKWDNDIFYPDLGDYSEEEIEKAVNSIGFKAAMEEIEDPNFDPHARGRRARSVIEHNGGRYKQLQLLILDSSVVMLAAEEAQDTDFDPAARASRARSVITKYASSPERAQAMLDELGL